MGARNGVTAAIMVAGRVHRRDGRAGRRAQRARGVFHRAASPRKWWPALGSRFFVTETAIKIFSVGYPIQAPLDAFLDAAPAARPDR